jgi:hypothetical protein
LIQVSVAAGEMLLPKKATIAALPVISGCWVAMRVALSASAPAKAAVIPRSATDACRASSAARIAASLHAPSLSSQRS